MNQESKLKYLKAKEKYLRLKNQQGSGNPPMLALQDRETIERRQMRQNFERRAVLKAQQLYQADERKKKAKILQYKLDLEQTPILNLDYNTVFNILKYLNAYEILNLYFSFEYTNKDYKKRIQYFIWDYINFKYDLNKKYNNDLFDNYFKLLFDEVNQIKRVLDNLKYDLNRTTADIIFELETEFDYINIGEMIKNELLDIVNYDGDIFNDLKNNKLVIELESILYDLIIENKNFFMELKKSEDYYERTSRGRGLKSYAWM